MGPSGSGKTTILRAVAGLERFQAGRIAVDGVALAGGARRPAGRRCAQLRRKVGMVFQFHCLFEHLSAIDNVCLAPVHALGVTVPDARRRGARAAGRVRRRAPGRGAPPPALGRRGAARRDRARAGGRSAAAADGRTDGVARSRSGAPSSARCFRSCSASTARSSSRRTTRTSRASSRRGWCACATAGRALNDDQRQRPQRSADDSFSDDVRLNVLASIVVRLERARGASRISSARFRSFRLAVRCGAAA